MTNFGGRYTGVGWVCLAGGLSGEESRELGMIKRDWAWIDGSGIRKLKCHGGEELWACMIHCKKWV